MKLGLKGHKEDPRGRTLKLGDFLVPERFAVVANADLALDYPPDRDPLGNDAVGNCGIAGPGHFARWEDARCGLATAIDAAAVLREYEAFGYVPDDPSTDNGVYALDVFKRWRSVGMFGRQIEAFAQVDYFDAAQVQAAVFLLGGWFACYNLPRSVQGLDYWDVEEDDGGSWGGHLVWHDGTDTCNSWGQRILVTPRFRSRYCFDGYAVVSPHGLRQGLGFGGLDLDKMRAALAVVTG